MSKILRDQSGRIWIDSSNKVLRTQDFSTQVIQGGLSFWGVADASSMTLVNGKISELYDIRDTGKTGVTYGKMVQATDSQRMSFINDLMQVNGNISRLTMTLPSYNVGTMFIVMIQESTLAEYSGLATAGSPAAHFLGYKLSLQVGAAVGQRNTQYPFYYNNTKYLVNQTITNSGKLMVLGCNSFTNDVSTSISIGQDSAYPTDKTKIKEFGWYNRVLSEQEVLYNQQALMQKYNLV